MLSKLEKKYKKYQQELQNKWDSKYKFMNTKYKCLTCKELGHICKACCDFQIVRM